MGEVWLAATTVDGRRFVNLFAARLPRDLELREIDLGYTVGARLVAMDATCTAPRGGACHAATGLPRLRRGGSGLGFQLWSLVQLEEEGWTLLGEVHHPEHGNPFTTPCNLPSPFLTPQLHRSTNGSQSRRPACAPLRHGAQATGTPLSRWSCAARRASW